MPCVVDLAAMRDAIRELGGDPRRINPLQPVDLVIDHSVQVDHFGDSGAFLHNAKLEFERNEERYALLRWGQQAFDNFRVVPPDTGIVHQVNLEYLAKVVYDKMEDGALLAYPDTLVGTDSHTTMINGLGVLGWGVGGIEAEAAMLGQPMPMLMPEVVGFKLTGALREGATATDLVLTVTQMLREKGVVGKFVEFYGAGLSTLRSPTARRSPTWRRSTARRWASSRSTPRRSRTCASPAGRMPLVDLVEAYTKDAGPLPHRRHARPGVHRHARARPRRRRAEHRRAEAAAGPRAVSSTRSSRGGSRSSACSRRGSRTARSRSASSGGSAKAVARQARARGRRARARRQPVGERDRRRRRRDVRHHARRGRHRGDHVVHEHVEPGGDARVGTAGEEGGRARADDQAVGEDDPRAGLAGRDRLPR